MTWSLDTLSLATQIAGLAVAFCVGLFTAGRSNQLGLVIGIGLLANLIGQLMLAGGGPGAFVGFFILPILCTLCWLVGKLVRLVASALGGRTPR